MAKTPPLPKPVRDLRTHLTQIIDSTPRASRDVIEPLKLTRRLMGSLRWHQSELVKHGRQDGVPDAAMAAALGKKRQNMARDFPQHQPDRPSRNSHPNPGGTK